MMNKNIVEIQLKLEELEENGIVENEIYEKEIVPQIPREVFNIPIEKQAFDIGKRMKELKMLVIFYAIIIIPIVFLLPYLFIYLPEWAFGGGEMWGIYFIDKSRVVLVFLLIIIFFQVWRTITLKNIFKVQTLAYKLGELLRSGKSVLNVKFEPKQFRLIGHYYANNLKEISRYEIRKLLKVHKSALTPGKLKHSLPWLGFFFKADKDCIIFKLKEIKFKVTTDKKLPLEVINKIEEGLKNLFIIRCLLER